MSLPASVRAPRNRASRMCFAAAAGALLLSVISVAVPVSAETDCSFELQFQGINLLNNGNNDTAGPFDVDIEAGTYNIVVQSFDNHDAQADLGLAPQPEEQFHIVLDSGYRSPATNDVPADENTATTVFRDQTVEASTSLTLEHTRVGNINSVFPISVCFIEAGSDAPLPGVVCESLAETAEGRADAAVGGNEGDGDAADGGDAVDGDPVIGPDGCPVEVVAGDVVVCDVPGEAEDANVDAADGEAVATDGEIEEGVTGAVAEIGVDADECPIAEDASDAAVCDAAMPADADGAADGGDAAVGDADVAVDGAAGPVAVDADGCPIEEAPAPVDGVVVCDADADVAADDADAAAVCDEEEAEAPAPAPAPAPEPAPEVVVCDADVAADDAAVCDEELSLIHI